MIKLYSFVISFLIVFFIFSCSGRSNYNWKVYNSNTTGLRPQYEGFNQLIIKADIFYLLGSFDESLKWKDKQALVYKSEDQGKTWLNVFEEKGNAEKGYYSSENIYLVKEIYIENSFKNSQQRLLKLDNSSNSIHKFKRQSNVKYIHVDELGKGALILSNSFSSKDYSVFRTKNNFKTYDSIPIDKAVKGSFVTNDRVYLLTYKAFRKNYKVFETNKIHILDENNALDSLDLDFNVDYFLVEKGESFWFLGKNNDSIQLRKRKGDVTNIINTLSIDKEETSKKLYKHNDFIAILTSSIDKGALGGFGSVRYKLYLSFDNGQTFKEENPPIDDYVNPIAFYKDEKIIIYSGAGRISVCDLKK